MPFPPLPPEWESTRAALHAHAAMAGAVARAHVPPHPRWWHISLSVTAAGLTTDPIPLPDGGSAAVVIDPADGSLRVEQDGDVTGRFDLATLPSIVAREVFAHLHSLGLPDTYERDRLHDDPIGEYSAADAAAFWAALVEVAASIEAVRSARPGERGPVQLWPHGFDLAFEWFGTRTTPDGSSAQLNLGWYPAGEAYFYSNPWPFDPTLTSRALPEPARWHTEGWEGSLLPYSAVEDDSDGPARFTEYADAVFRIARPTLDA